jgi:serine protease Do
MRSILILYTRTALAACLVFVALSCPGQADDYGIARAVFNKLPIDQRYETQALLGVAGYWPAVANDEFSHRLFEAFTHFQAENGFPVSGILTAAQIDRVRQIADPILAYWQLQAVRHPITGLPLWVPFGVGFNQNRTRSGIDFENVNKIAAISFNFFPNRSLGSTYARLLNIAGGPPSYSKLKDNFFVIVTEGGGANAYSRYQAIAGGIIGFTLSWPQDDAQNAVLHGERLATLMSDLFRANIELSVSRSPPAPPAAIATVLPHAQIPSPQTAVPPAPEGKKQDNQKLFGTGFLVSSEGHIITNSHVVKDCSSVQVTMGLAPKMAGRIMARDAANDLALIKVETHPTTFASLRSGVRLGEGVAVFGFPLAGLLATSGNFTLGNVTAVAGLGDDTRILQISAPVQPGNSGGPLLDYSGNVVGVVEGKLNAITVATVTNDMAQNVNFAIKANVVTNFLDANSVAYTNGSLVSTVLQSSEIAERAKSLAVMIECNK